MFGIGVNGGVQRMRVLLLAWGQGRGEAKASPEVATKKNKQARKHNLVSFVSGHLVFLSSIRLGPGPLENTAMDKVFHGGNATTRS